MNILIDSCVFIDSFDPQSPNHEDSLRLLDDLRNRDILIAMPAHGWFEVQCTLQRLIKEKRFVGPMVQGQMNYPVELIHIDKLFIQKYSMADIPYIKAGDHIFIAVAKINSCPLVTSDFKMTEVAKHCGVHVFTPAEYAKKLASCA